MADTMREKVAVALQRHWTRRGTIQPLEAFLVEADAAIEAMREPTGTMKAAGYDAFLERGDHEEIWQAMIDAEREQGNED